MDLVVEDTKTVEIDGVRYLITHPMVETAWEVGIDLMKMIGGSAASMAGVGGDAEKAAPALVLAVESFLHKLDAKSSMTIIKRLLASVEVQGIVDGPNKKFMLNDSGIKTHFKARIGSMMRLTGEVIAFTHADFFDAIVDGIATMMKKASDKLA